MNVKVLIVDDQPPFRAAAKTVVELTDGFEVLAEAETGEESVAITRDLKPDLVLMDLNLPGINGLEATRQILLQDQGCVVVVVSTYEAEEFEQRALDAGARAYISKSEFSPDSLVEAWSAASGQ